MPTPSIKFKKMLCNYDRLTRDKILSPLMNWLSQQISVDPNASAFYNTLQEILAVNSWAETKAFKEHHMWLTISNHDSCISFQEIVKSKLAVPQKNINVAIKNSNAEPRKTIPKKIRGEAWKNQFGDSTKGACFCCKKELDIFDNWHAGHILSHSNGGTDTSNNLRPVCGSCNLSMGTENMDDFKKRCYPETTLTCPIVDNFIKNDETINKDDEAVAWYPGILLRQSPKYIRWNPGTNSLEMSSELEKNNYKYNKERKIFVKKA
jgi:hypothetical protein